VHHDAGAALAEANAYAFLAHHASSPHVRLIERADCRVLCADSDARPFNTVFAPRLGADDDLASRAREITGLHTATGRAPVWWIGPGSPAGLADGLTQLGFARLPPVVLMSAPLPPGAAAPPGPGASTAVVRTPAAAALFAEVLHAATATDAGAAFTHRVLASLPLDADAPLQHVVVRARGGLPVAVASVFTHDGVAGLYNVATVPGRRRQGYGTWAARAALGLAHARGVRTATLGAEAGAVGIYRRLGFRARGEMARVRPVAEQPGRD
jgi:GNAT superfamily N-acetyltransferase